MKKITLSVAAAITLTLASCGTSGLSTAASLLGSATGNSTASTVASAASTGASALSSIISTATSGNNLTNLISSVIGLDKMTASDLVGTWKYSQPGCAFTSESALAKAGGEVVASNVKEKLASTYNSVGIKSSNTTFTFNSDGSFSGKLMGQAISGTYTFNESTQEITFTTLLMSMKGYAKKNTDGIAILFESKKVLSIVQTLGAVSGNSTLSTISDISSNYSAVRIGFDMTK